MSTRTQQVRKSQVGWTPAQANPLRTVRRNGPPRTAPQPITALRFHLTGLWTPPHPTAQAHRVWVGESQEGPRLEAASTSPSTCLPATRSKKTRPHTQTQLPRWVLRALALSALSAPRARPDVHNLPSTFLFLPQAVLGLPSRPPSLLGKEVWGSVSVFPVLLSQSDASGGLRTAEMFSLSLLEVGV